MVLTKQQDEDSLQRLTFAEEDRPRFTSAPWRGEYRWFSQRQYHRSAAVSRSDRERANSHGAALSKVVLRTGPHSPRQRVADDRLRWTGAAGGVDIAREGFGDIFD